MDISPEPQGSVPPNLTIPPQVVSTAPTQVLAKAQTSAFIKFIRVFLLVLIVIGVGLLITQNLWVPRVVSAILGSTKSTPSSSLNTTASTTTNSGFTSSNEAVQWYKDPNYNYNILFPNDWSIAGASTTDVTLTSSASDASLRIYVTAPSNTTDQQGELDAYVQGKEAQLQKDLPTFKLVSDVSASGYGTPSSIITGTWTDSNGTANETEILMIVRDGRIYELSGTTLSKSWATYQPIFALSFASFTFESDAQVLASIQKILATTSSSPWVASTIPAQLPGAPSFSIGYPQIFGQPSISTAISNPSAIDPENNTEDIIFYAPNSPQDFPYAENGAVEVISLNVYQLKSGQTLKDLASSIVNPNDKNIVQTAMTVNGQPVIKQLLSPTSGLAFYYIEAKPGVALGFLIPSKIAGIQLDPGLNDKIMESVKFLNQ